MIAAMALSPLRMAFPGSNALRWLINRRRDLGLGAFADAVLRTILYLVDMKAFRRFSASLFLGIRTGRFAFVTSLLLAVLETCRIWRLSIRRRKAF